jgi:hypothetical protein
MKAFRYSYQPTGVDYRIPLLVATSFNTEKGAKGLINRWNKRDRGVRVWSFEESLPGDVDHPHCERGRVFLRTGRFPKLCTECGHICICFVTPDGVSHHGEPDDIDYDADAAHVAVPEQEESNGN